MTQRRQGFARAFALSALAMLAVLVAVVALWIVNLRLGPPLDGFTGGAMVAIAPLLLLVLGIVWIVLRIAMRNSVNWRPAIVVAAAAGFAYVAVAAMCGPVACFVPGSNRLLGWFVVGGVVLAALAHHAVFTRLTREPAP